jgi:2-polyprenyl-6-methoxyphenol hydroxylase-like FAD-dependent oxidoreductase
VQDAFNLGWKLAAVVRGEAGDELLDTYEKERHQVAARVLQNTRAQTALTRTDPQTDALREVGAMGEEALVTALARWCPPVL